MSTYARNFIVFTVLLGLCAGGLAYGFYKGREEIDRGTDWVNLSYSLIANAYELSTLVEASLAANRAYMMTGDATFITEYDTYKNDISANLRQLAGMMKDNPSQSERLEQTREKFDEFAEQLEERAEEYAEIKKTHVPIRHIEGLSTLKKEIRDLNNLMIREESQLLAARISSLERKKSEYLKTMLVGGLIAIIFLALINAFLLRVQERRGNLEKDLGTMKERLALALRGSRDGIYDWNMLTNQIYWSPEYKSMLGYSDDEIHAGTETFGQLAHPDEVDAVWAAAHRYIDGETTEFNQVFRMRHKSGRWVWVQSRGKVLYNTHGTPVRFVGTHSDVSSLKEAELQMKKAREKAESASQAKTNFLAHMSHEIRTPLTAISGIAEIFGRNHKNLDDKQKKLVDTLNSSTRVLRELITDILDFSKIESGDLDLDEQTFPLAGLFEQVNSMMAVKASEKSIGFSFEYDALRHMDFHGDQMRLRQILINLIGNAIKFTDNGAVTVKAYIENRHNGDFLRVDVTDTGIGIAPENFGLVFEQFKQADSSVSRKYGGSGLGLSISRNLARLMKGDILLQSEQGRGSTFSLVAPSRMRRGAGAAPAQIARPAAAAQAAPESRILMVEDYEGNVVVLGYILDELGCRYDRAHNGRIGVEMWEKSHYDLVLMDVQMPEMDGFTATRLIRQKESELGLSPTPIIGMTAHALVGDKDKCIAAGMDAYLPKPIVEAELKAAILHQLGKDEAV